MTAFKALGLEENLLKAIADMGFETPSEVQEKTIPILRIIPIVLLIVYFNLFQINSI